MLQEQSKFFQQILFVVDMVLISLCWIVSYYLRFEVFVTWPVPLPEWVPLDRYLFFLPWIVIVAAVVFWSAGLYAPNRAQRLTHLVRSVARSVGISLIVLMAFLSFYRDFYVSRLTILFFALFSPAAIFFLRLFLYWLVRRARARGVYIRRVLIVGAGVTGRRLEEAFKAYPWIGLSVVGFVDDHKHDEPGILGKTTDLTNLIDDADNPVDYVFIALPLSAAKLIESLLGQLSTRHVNVCLVPDLLQHDIINSRISEVSGMPILHIMDEAPIDIRRITKRVIDVVFSILFLLFTSPLLMMIAIAVRRSSPGPILYRQKRVSLNGYEFEMLKFRSMPVDAEKDSGAVWAKEGESRATKVGTFLRRTSLDELPQFINVLKGDMSVVGPRPERPVFIDQFKDRIPRYMQRHKVKAGITGWAQVNGWRGNTSLEKRIQHDLYYIQNWSLVLDLKIIFLTAWKGFVNRNAY